MSRHANQDVTLEVSLLGELSGSNKAQAVSCTLGGWLPPRCPDVIHGRCSEEIQPQQRSLLMYRVEICFSAHP